MSSDHIRVPSSLLDMSLSEDNIMILDESVLDISTDNNNTTSTVEKIKKKNRKKPVARKSVNLLGLTLIIFIN